MSATGVAPLASRHHRSPQAALFESARDDMRWAHLAAQAMQLRRQVADDATVDQFIRHAESGFFGGEDPDFEWRVGDY